jgi:hypothetical protein
MNHSFLLKHYGNLTIEEQNNMTFEDRKWWIERIKKERDDQNKSNRQPTSGQRNHTPGQPQV